MGIRNANPLCRWCRRNKAHMRGLCMRCWGHRERRLVADPKLSLARCGSYVRRGNGHDSASPVQLDPRGGTLSLPGSDERLEVMSERAANGWDIRHPDDAVRSDDGLGSVKLSGNGGGLRVVRFGIGA